MRHWLFGGLIGLALASASLPDTARAEATPAPVAGLDLVAIEFAHWSHALWPMDGQDQADATASFDRFAAALLGAEARAGADLGYALLAGIAGLGGASDDAAVLPPHEPAPVPPARNAGSPSPGALALGLSLLIAQHLKSRQ